MPSNKSGAEKDKMDRLVAEARRNREQRESGYRERALKLFPWICGRCAREFTQANVRTLTVHHKDGNHDNNPPDGSNWELLCIYCHENEHARYLDHDAQAGAEPGSNAGGPASSASHKAFAGLDALLKRKGGG